MSVEITTDAEIGKVQLALIAEEIDREHTKVIRGIGKQTTDALREATPRGKTGNLKAAVFGTGYKFGEGGPGAGFVADAEVGNFKYVVGFKDETARTLPGGQYTQSPLKYVLAQNYGDTTFAEMHMQVRYIPGLGGSESQHDLRDGAGRATWATVRTIPAKHFIEEAQTKAVTIISDTQVAQFMRGTLT
jgi:hypothetical protein